MREHKVGMKRFITPVFTQAYITLWSNKYKLMPSYQGNSMMRNRSNLEKTDKSVD